VHLEEIGRGGRTTSPTSIATPASLTTDPFRFGTSPHRYLIGRRLERVKAEIARGCPLAESAYDAGFADQSHMTRHFKARFGLTPGRYLALVRGRARKTVSRCAPSRRRTVSQGDTRPGLR